MTADILVVDDTPDNIRFLSKILLEQGYNVRKALNGKMALTAARAMIPDLILLDINMPDMSGFTVCKQLKIDPLTHAVPIIFLSALDDISDKVKAFQAGAVDYITKPFQVEEVLVRIQTQMKIRNLQEELEIKNQRLEDSLLTLERTQVQLIQKGRMAGLGNLVAGLAHEINNPINFISGNLLPASQYVESLVNLVNLYRAECTQPSANIQELTEDIDLDFTLSDLKNLMSSMKNGADRIKGIVSNLRIFARLDESDVKSVDIHEGIDSTVSLLHHRLKLSGKEPEIQVIKNYAQLPKVTCYASLMNQVFLSLLDNSIDAIELKLSQNNLQEFIPKIWINTELTERESVLITVKDNGIGIEKSNFPNLFDPFFTTKSVGKGTGLGLSITYQVVVDQHRGRIECESLPGEGAEFMIEIPLMIN